MAWSRLFPAALLAVSASLTGALTVAPVAADTGDLDISGNVSSGLFGQLFGGDRQVTVRFTPADLDRRSKLQDGFVKVLIWRRYGRNTRFGKALVAKVDAHYQGLIRDKFVAQVRERYPEVYPFGHFVDRMVGRIAKILRASDRAGEHSFTVTIPKHFFVKRGEMNLVIEVVKDRVPHVEVHQIFNGERIHLFTSLAAPGNFYKRFGTPNGIMYTSRFIRAPRWYPCATKWAKEACRQPRGMNTAFGLGGIDLTRKDYLVGYGPKWGNGTVSPYLIHSTNMYGSPGRYASHGCVRLYPHKADDLFDALVHYYAEPGSARTRDFGEIHPFVKTIPVLLGSPAQIRVYRRQLSARGDG